MTSKREKRNVEELQEHTNDYIDGQSRDAKGNRYEHIQQQPTNQNAEGEPYWAEASLLRG